MTTRIRIVVAAACALGCSIQATAAEGAFYGMLRSRDLTPFGFIRLDMRPAHAITIDPGTFAFETELGYQNTWALSPEVENYLKGLESTGRRSIGPAELQAIQQLPGENYMVDLENASVDFTMHFKISSKWAIYAIANAISYQGGFLDSAIEEFHDLFGFSTYGRPAVARNQLNIIYDLKGIQFVDIEPPATSGFTDPTVGLRYSGWQMSRSWKLSFEVAAKIGLQGRETFLSTGRTDWGAQVSLQNTGAKNAFYVDAAAVYYAGALEPTPQEAQVIPTLVFGWERVLTEHTNLNLQGYVSRSVFTRDQTDLGELLGMKYQLSLGFRHRIKNMILSYGVTENLQNFNNTPDIGFQLGLAFVPHRKGD